MKSNFEYSTGSSSSPEVFMSCGRNRRYFLASVLAGVAGAFGTTMLSAGEQQGDDERKQEMLDRKKGIHRTMESWFSISPEVQRLLGDDGYIHDFAKKLEALYQLGISNGRVYYDGGGFPLLVERPAVDPFAQKEARENRMRAPRVAHDGMGKIFAPFGVQLPSCVVDVLAREAVEHSSSQEVREIRGLIVNAVKRRANQSWVSGVQQHIPGTRGQLIRPQAVLDYVSDITGFNIEYSPAAEEVLNGMLVSVIGRGESSSGFQYAESDVLQLRSGNLWHGVSQMLRGRDLELLISRDVLKRTSSSHFHLCVADEADALIAENSTEDNWGHCINVHGNSPSAGDIIRIIWKKSMCPSCHKRTDVLLERRVDELVGRR